MAAFASFFASTIGRNEAANEQGMQSANKNQHVARKYFAGAPGSISGMSETKIVKATIERAAKFFIQSAYNEEDFSSSSMTFGMNYPQGT